MSKLSPELKALIADPAAKGGDVPAPSPEATAALFARLRAAPHVGRDTWLCLATAVLFTINSPATLCRLYDEVTADAELPDQILVASAMREVGLKCISFGGVPRSINNLGALHAHLGEEVRAGLPQDPERSVAPPDAVREAGQQLWDDIYGVHARALVEKLSAFHPDLALYILRAHYGPLLTDPDADGEAAGRFRLGRIRTSVIAIGALRALTGVGLQVTSHVHGLKKAAHEGRVQGEQWLVSDEGCMWILRTADDIVNTVLRS